MLIDRDWQFKYTPEDGDLVRVFYVPALQDAARYDRLTGYFDAGALAPAARGVEALVRNGRMRLVVGCTLHREETYAIREGETLRNRVQRGLAELPLAPPDADAAHALKLPAWMIGRRHLDMTVAVPCDAYRRPIGGTRSSKRSPSSSRIASDTRSPGRMRTPCTALSISTAGGGGLSVMPTTHSGGHVEDHPTRDPQLSGHRPRCHQLREHHGRNRRSERLR